MHYKRIIGSALAALVVGAGVTVPAWSTSEAPSTPPPITECVFVDDKTETTDWVRESPG